MKTKFSHVNLVSRDWRALAHFYIKVFELSRQIRDLPFVFENHVSLLYIPIRLSEQAP